ncbi:hypothetical protein SLOPH_1721 [Spraguea lophii 42_110]|uniref:Very-long-chain (3R)-3-hydroxyacyl-CoA dehydratase n=1 Tax=Spraguea lophii (strain 42_110) TaxID=1358809 RepID=S7WA06_SPRLO|nr:hypothetical protein SLOPH_1721 [Spraguea lophii 42_110]
MFYFCFKRNIYTKKILLPMGYIGVYNSMAIIVISFATVFSVLYYLWGDKKYLLYTALCQSFFGIEIINICAGMSRAKLLPTLMQLFSRNFIIWAVAYCHNFRSKELLIMLLSWFISDIIRYLFYFFRIRIFKALRYNLFLVLYPLGTLIEIYLLSKIDMLHKGIISVFIRILILLYFPGFLFLYIHMLSRRKYTMKNFSDKNK